MALRRPFAVVTHAREEIALARFARSASSRAIFSASSVFLSLGDVDGRFRAQAYGRPAASRRGNLTMIDVHAVDEDGLFDLQNPVLAEDLIVVWRDRHPQPRRKEIAVGLADDRVARHAGHPVRTPD